MDKCYLDANMLVYFEDANSQLHQKSVELLIGLAEQNYRPYISPLVLDEFLYSLRKKLFTENKELEEVHATLTEALEYMLDIPDMKLINPPTQKAAQLEVTKYMQKYSLKPRDAYHLLTMKANGINKIATFDTDFEKVAKAGVLEVIK